ncbi:putative protein tag-278 isoform X1 [Onthophagus taurus]|uniref:putative protein tag-278 isoform X1 n=1 Tax=Onthophagus taurus TaxID=166361 RepID=UPI0039BECD61
MFRVLITSACILFVIVVAIIIANTISTDRVTIGSADKLESNLNPNSKGNSTIREDLEAVNITNQTVVLNSSKEADSVIVASNIAKEVKVLQDAAFGDGKDQTALDKNVSAIITSKEKQIVQLQTDIKEAEIDLKGKMDRLKQLEHRALTAKNLSDETQKQFDMLINAMNVLQNSIIQTSKSANEAFWQAQLQTAKYNDAKRRHSKLSAELEDSKSEYSKMKVAVDQAMKAAKIAMGNVQVPNFNINKE